MPDNETIARGTYDAWNRREFDALADVMAPDGKIVIVGTGDTFTGPDGSRQYSTMWADAFPDGRGTVDRVVAAGDLVAVEYTGRGTHTGDLVTSMGTIPATGRSVTIHMCDVLEIHDGKITSQNTYFDTASVMAQLGVTAEQMAATQKK